MTELPAITLPAELVIPAWRNAFLATATYDDAAEALRRTVLVEWYPTGLRFVATDSYVLVASWAGDDRQAYGNLAPAHDEAPTGSVVAVAADALMSDFLKHRAKEVKAWKRENDPGPGPIDVTFSIGTIEEPDTPQQRLDIGSTSKPSLIVSCDNERIALPIFEGDYPTWRAILDSYTPTPRAKVAARRDVLARIGLLDSLPGDEEDAWLNLTMANGGGLVLVTGAGRVPLEGAFVPRREEKGEIEVAA